MLRLQTFGGLTLSRGSENLTGAVTQRRRLAILALLAVAGDAGMSRDKLQAYLWPDSDAAHARHVLNQLLYAQRRHVGDQLFLGRKTLRLNPAVLWTDVSAFEQAVSGGDFEGAVALYRGPFLDGFFLKDAPEFEQWGEGERARFARRVTALLTQLADRAAAAGHLGHAAEWWNRAGALDPYDGAIALGLVRTLLAAGDRAGAVMAARRHEDALRRDLGVAPDRRFADATAELR